MNSELIKKREELEKQLKEVKAERKILLDKVNNGGILTKKEGKKNQELAALIKELNGSLAIFKKLDLYISIQNNLERLNDDNTPNKECLKATILGNFKKINTEINQELKNSTSLSTNEIKNIQKTKTELENNITGLEEEFEIETKVALDTSELEKKIKNLKETLELVNNYIAKRIDIVTIENDLDLLINPNTNTEDKNGIIIKYNIIINDLIEELSKKIAETVELKDVDENETDLESNNDKKDIKRKTKEKLAKITKDGEYTSTIIGGISLGIIGSIILLVTLRSCSKDNTNKPVETTTATTETNITMPEPLEPELPYEIEFIYDNANKEVVNALVNKGYSEYSAILMDKNFSKETIEVLKKVPFIQDVENYANETNFNINYINDYENARIRFNLTADKTTDYVNRAHKIQNTNFYEDATINEIVEVVMAIDTQVFNNVADQAINNSMVEIYNKYLENSIMEEDINKLDAIKYFAQENTDLGKFLNEYSSLIQNILTTQNNKEENDIARNNMYEFLYVYANAFSGYYDQNNETIKINDNAVVKDAYDWYIAHQSFIAPGMSMFITQDNLEDYVCLQTTIKGVLNQEPFVSLCGESRTLGGE